MTKAIIDFSVYTAPELLPIADTIHDLMVTNAATFTGPPMTMAAFAALISGLTAQIQAVRDGLMLEGPARRHRHGAGKNAVISAGHGGLLVSYFCLQRAGPFSN